MSSFLMKLTTYSHLVLMSLANYNSALREHCSFFPPSWWLLTFLDKKKYLGDTIICSHLLSCFTFLYE